MISNFLFKCISCLTSGLYSMFSGVKPECELMKTENKEYERTVLSLKLIF